MPSYWIFKLNPDLYRLDDRLNDPDNHTTWQVTRYRDEIRIGDMAFIWRAGPPRGLCAVIKIDSDPELMDEIPIEKKYYIALKDEPKIRVRGHYTSRFKLISKQEIKQVPGLENLSVFHGYQSATNFRGTQEEGAILEELIGIRAFGIDDQDLN